VADGKMTKTLAAQTAAIIEFVPQGGIGPPYSETPAASDLDGGGDGPPDPRTPCGCTAGGTSQLLLLLALLLQVQPRRRKKGA
jgi:uncharacterized protein (TIGR03382 family)